MQESLPATPGAPAAGNRACDRTVRISIPAPAAGPRPPATPGRETNGTAAYNIIAKIGDGGMGIVYLAKDGKLGRLVAIKRLKKSSLADPLLRRRFFHEAEAIAALHHNNIVHVYSLAEDSEGPYIVMEYVPGSSDNSPDKNPPRPFTLADKVQRDGPLNVPDALAMLIKIGRAMEYAHGKGVIHRDLKPSNILLDADGEPKIVDFGLAHRTASDSAPLTAPGEKILSLGYAAPEQEKDATRTDERTDVYGLGALLYFSLTGQNPRFFREKDLPETLRVPMTRALETERDKRWSCVGDFVQALAQIQAPSSLDLPSARTTWRCKWCDTVNPVAVQFCGKCGWNGGEVCGECGAESRVGIQFCGACGADAREYERVTRLLKSLEERRACRDFEYITRNAGQVAGFTPTGRNGQGMVDRVRHLQAEGIAATREYKTLRQLIDREVQEENYESALRHMDEMEPLSSSPPFEKLRQDLPGLIAARDMRHVREALAKGRLNYAKRNCENILARILPGNPEAAALLRSVNLQLLRRRTFHLAAAVILLASLYVFSAVPTYCLVSLRTRGLHDRLFRPVSWLHERTLFRAPLDAFANLLGVGGMFERTEHASSDRPVSE